LTFSAKLILVHTIITTKVIIKLQDIIHAPAHSNFDRKIYIALIPAKKGAEQKGLSSQQKDVQKRFKKINKNRL